MLDVNLLPKPWRKSIRLEQWRRVLLFFAAYIALALVFSSVLLLPSFLPMFFEKKELQKFISLEEESRQKLNTGKSLAEVKAIKSKLTQVKNFLGTTPRVHALWVFLLRTAAESGVSLRQASVSGEKISLSGLSPGRRELLLFEEKLKSSPELETVSSPLSDIIRGAASFTVQGQLKPGRGL